MSLLFLCVLHYIKSKGAFVALQLSHIDQP